MSETEFVPWEQLPDESGDAWAAFVTYRDQGPTRSLGEASRLARCSKNSCTKWSRSMDWAARARAWDAEVDRVRRERFLTEQRRIIKLHAEAAKVVREKAMEAIRRVKPSNLAKQPVFALKYLEVGCRLEAQSCGLPTEVTALSLSGGQAKPAEDVYFDSLPDEKLVDIVQMSIDTLRKDKGNTNGRDGATASDGQNTGRGEGPVNH